MLHQLQTRADQHEWGLAYNASSPARAIAGAVLAGQAVQFLNATLQAATTSGKSVSAPKLGIQFGAYGTFMSFFGLAQLPAVSADFTGIVDYASSMALELVTNSTVRPVAVGDVSVRFLFANGSAALGEDGEQGLRAFPLFGQQETVLPWSTFAEEMNKFAVGGTEDWCKVCGNTTGVCAAAGTASGSSSGGAAAGASDGDGGVSRPVAGVIGAVVTLAVVLVVEGLIMAVAGLRVVRKRGLTREVSAGDKASIST